MFALDPKEKVPTVYNYTLGVQTQLPFKIVLDAAYVGSLSRHLQNNRNLNAVPYGAAFLPQNQDPTRASACPAGSLPGCAALTANFMRPLQGYGNVTLYESTATANYNSLQVSLNRRLQRFFFGADYTWSNFLTTANGDFTTLRPDGLSRQADYGPAGNDRRHNFVASYVYALPSVRGNNPFLRALTSGWQLSGIAQFISGSPITPGFSVTNVNNQAFTGSTEGVGSARLLLIGDPSTHSDNPYNRINAAAFAVPRFANPAAGQFSRGLESGVNYLTGPGINNWHVSLQKTFTLKERVHLQFRVDVFNVFNHPHFSGYNATLNFTCASPCTATSVITGPTNLPYDANGNFIPANRNGFGTVNGARNPRFLQTVVRLQF